MKITETERVYCFDLAKGQFRKLLDRDDAVLASTSPNAGTLISRVCNINGVREVYCDPMFGPSVHVRVESEDQQAMAETLENVKKEIAKYVR